jgi:hypothetical protein
VLPVVVPDDATLARGVADGDGRALAAVYDRYAGRLLAFCQSIVRDDGAAQSCLEATFAITAVGLAQVSPAPILRAWLFGVARAECRRVLDARVAAVFEGTVDPGAPVDPVDSIGLIDPTGDTIGLLEPIGPIDVLDEIAPISSAEPAGAGPQVDETSYANHLVLELADRQRLPVAEVGLAIGVPSATAVAALARARRADRARSFGLLGPGRTFAPEMAGIRSSVLAAADAGPIAATSGWPAGWLSGWPPPDPAFGAMPITADRRRWGAPLAVLAVLLLALGAILGLLATTGGSHKSPAGLPAAATSSAAPTSTGPLPTAGSTTATADPTGSGPGGPLAVAPPTPSQPSTAATTPTATASSGAFTLVVTTDKQPVLVRAGSVANTCAAKKSCSYAVASGAVVAVTDALRSGPGPSVRLDSFSAPASCVGSRGTCVFVMTANVSIKLTTPGR